MANLRDLASRIKKRFQDKINDNEGFFQQGKFTPIKGVVNAVSKAPILFSPKMPQQDELIKTDFRYGEVTEFGKEIAQGFLRMAPEGIMSLREFMTGQKMEPIVPTTPAQKFVAGDKPLTSFQTQTEKFGGTLQNYGVPGKAAIPLAVAGIAVSKYMDLLPGIDDLIIKGGKKVVVGAVDKMVVKKVAGDIEKKLLLEGVEKTLVKKQAEEEAIRLVEKRTAVLARNNPNIKIKTSTNLADNLLPTMPKTNQLVSQTPEPGNVKILKENVSLADSTTNATKVPIGSTSKYNIGKIKIKNKETLRQAIDEVKPSFEKVVGEPITHKEILKQAKKTSNEITKLIGRKTTEELGAAQSRIRQNIAKMADNGAVTPELLEALRTDTSFGRSTAQLLGQRAISARPRTELGKNMLKYLDAVNNVADDIDAVTKAAKGVNFNDVDQAAAFYRQFIKPNAEDWLDKVRYSSMLSSPNTTINNISINLQGTGLLAPIEKTVSGIIDAIVNRGKRQHYAGEGIEYAKGYLSNLKPALTKLFDTMKGGSDSLEIFDIPLTSKGSVGRAAEVTFSLPQRIQQAVDEFFKVLTKSGLEKANTYRTAKGGVNQSVEMIENEAKRRLFNQPFGSDQSTVLNWLEFVPSKIMEATHSKNKLLKWSAKTIFPFVRIPANVIKAGVEYSPVGLTTMIGAPNKVEQASKALMGTATALGAYMLAQGDRLTGAPPASEKLRTAQKAAGIQNYSMRFGDTWVSYEKTHPIVAFNFAMAAGIKDQMDKQTIADDQLDNVLGVAANWMKYVANQSYMRQVGTLVDLAEGNATAATQFFSNAVTQVIPYKSLMGWVARAFDPNERKVDPDGSVLDKALGSILLSIPGLRDNLPPLLDQLGNPIFQPNRLTNLGSPFKTSQENPTGVDIFKSMREKSLETSKDNAITDKLKKSATGEATKLTGEGRYAWFDKEKAEVVKVDISEPIAPPEYTGDKEFDKIIKSQYKTKLRARQKDIVLLLQKEMITQEEATSMMAEMSSLLLAMGEDGSRKKSITQFIKPSTFKMPGLTQTKGRFKTPQKITYAKAPITKLSTPKTPRSIKIAQRTPQKSTIKLKAYTNTLMGR